MGNPDHISILKSGVHNWNQWRRENPTVSPDLSRAELQRLDLYEADFHKTNLVDARMMGVDATRANFEDSDLNGVFINDARAWYARFWKCNLRGAYLWGTDFREADFSGADLSGANLRNTQLVMTKFCSAHLDGCKIYGVSAWDVDLQGASQTNLVISHPHHPNQITVGNLEVGQFIYLLLNNAKIREVIDTIGRKGVLLLGRFSGGRMAVLERLQTELSRRDYIPIVFNFEKPETKDFTETVRLLAGMSHFVIVDLTSPRSVPLELQATVPDCFVPFVPIIEKGEEPFSMFVDLSRKHWVLNPIRYSSVDRLVQVLETDVIAPAEKMFARLQADKARALDIRDV
jgi:hypothetical protein